MHLFDMDLRLGLSCSRLTRAGLIYAHDAHGAAGSLINFDQRSAQAHLATRNGKRGREIRYESVHDRIDCTAQDGVNGSAHAGIAYKSCAAGEDLLVGRLNMRMSPDDSGDSSVEKATHGNFFTC